MTQATHDCTGCPVSAGTHKPAGAVHLISEPAAALVATCDSAANLPAPAYPAEGVPAPVAAGEREAFEQAYAAHAIEYAGLDDSQESVSQRLKETRRHDRYEHLHDSGAWVGWQLARASLAATTAAPAEYIEVRECSECGHVGINDADGSKAACNTCDWQGDSPSEDKCPACEIVGTMTSACAKCGARTSLIAEKHATEAGVPAAAPDARDAARYRWLRSRDLETIGQGGVFAGMTPQNVILNENDLDEAIDAAIAAQAGKGGAA